MKMEAIKISVEVSVNLSENTQNFIKSLFGGTIAAVATQTQKSTPEAPAASAKPASQPVTAVTPDAEAPAAEAPAAEAPAAEAPAAEAPAAEAPAAASKSIEDVRKMLVQKVDAHRDAIKQKLNELGAPSVTKLDPSKYDDMYNFLNSL
jgi:hypothetical protein